MGKVFPCYSIADRQLAYELAAFLERGSGAEVLLEEGEIEAGGDLVSKVEEGLAADVVLVLLSPDSVPSRWILERWKPVFRDQAAELGTELATLLCRDSRFPDLLRRQNFFDLRQNQLAGFRKIKRWLMSLTPPPQKAPFTPARLPSFNGRDGEIETLSTMIADTPGIAVVEGPSGVGKTALAVEFARRHQEEFDGIFWLTCGTRSAAALAGDLAAQLGVRLDRDLEANLNQVRHLCSRYRCLLVLDDAELPIAAQMAQRGRTSVLVTTRRGGLAGELSAATLELSGARPVDPAELAETIRGLDGAEQRFLCALCACAPQGFPLDMAVRTADTETEEANEMMAWFVSKGVVAPLDENGARLLVPAMVRERAGLRGDGERWARHHALAVAELFGAQTAGAPDPAPFWPDLQHAFGRALGADWGVASSLARRGVKWAKTQDRLAEAFEMLQDWSRTASARGDRKVLEDCAWEQIWILEHWGRSGEARELDDIRRERYADQMPLSFE